MSEVKSPPAPAQPRSRDLSDPASAVPAQAALSPAAQALAGAALAGLHRWLADQGRPADDAALADYLSAGSSVR